MKNYESFADFFFVEIVLILGILGLLFYSFKKNSENSSVPAGITLVTLGFALIASIGTHFSESTSLFYGMMAMDNFGQFFKIIILASGIVAVILSTQSKDLAQSPKPEFYAFLVTLTLGLVTMCGANDLLMMYLAIEMASIVSYVLAGFLADTSERSEESGLKYVLYGGVASAIMIFGMSLLYGLTGSLNLIEIREYLAGNATDSLVLFITFIFILAGLGYKMAIAPFHMWSPDVYEGAPMPITAFLSVASKAAGFAITLRFFLVGFITVDDGVWTVLKALDWQFLVASLAAITMTFGNLVALQQTNIKRFLAYSSVAHAGYMLMGVAVQNRTGIEGVMFYFMVYFLMNLGAFFVATIIANQFDTEEMSKFKGLARQGSYGLFLSLAMGIFFFSLAGIPPFAGFIGKWYIFKAVVDSGLIWLGVIGAINSVISLFYYVRLIKFMLIDEKEGDMPVQNSLWRFTTVISVFAFFTVCFGIYFNPLVEWAKASAELLR